MGNRGSRVVHHTNTVYVQPSITERLANANAKISSQKISQEAVLRSYDTSLAQERSNFEADQRLLEEQMRALEQRTGVEQEKLKQEKERLEKEISSQIEELKKRKQEAIAHLNKLKAQQTQEDQKLATLQKKTEEKKSLLDEEARKIREEIKQKEIDLEDASRTTEKTLKDYGATNGHAGFVAVAELLAKLNQLPKNHVDSKVLMNDLKQRVEKFSMEILYFLSKLEAVFVAGGLDDTVKYLESTGLLSIVDQVKTNKYSLEDIFSLETDEEIKSEFPNLTPLQVKGFKREKAAYANSEQGVRDSISNIKNITAPLAVWDEPARRLLEETKKDKKMLAQ